MDLSQDFGRMDAYLVPHGMSERAAGKRPARTTSIDRVDVAEQARLWDEATSQNSISEEASAGACASASTGILPSVDAAALDQLREMVGGPTAYLASLLRDSDGSVELAIEIHFGANEGIVPQAMDVDSKVSDSGAAAASRQLADASTAAAVSADDERTFPRNMVASVFGDDKSYRLFETREKVEARLRQLGARVTRRKGKYTTHCIVPTGTKRSLVPNLESTVTLRDEGWLFRHVQKWKAEGAVPRPIPPAPKPTSAKRRKVDVVAGEDRGCVTRKATTDKLQRVARALSDRLYLIRWVDMTDTGVLAAWPRHQFTVLGSTGNVYHCEISREPKCDCRDAAKGHICKHL